MFSQARTNLHHMLPLVVQEIIRRPMRNLTHPSHQEQLTSSLRSHTRTQPSSCSLRLRQDRASGMTPSPVRSRLGAPPDSISADSQCPAYPDHLVNEGVIVIMKVWPSSALQCLQWQCPKYTPGCCRSCMQSRSFRHLQQPPPAESHSQTRQSDRGAQGRWPRAV